MKTKFAALVSAFALCLGLAAPSAAAVPSFSDVPASHWARDAVEYTVDLGLFSGTNPTTFEPDATMSRAMLTQVLYRYAGSPAVSGTVKSETPFTDIPDNAYYTDAVVWAYQNSLFPTWFVQDADYLAGTPHPRTRFTPDQDMLRCEFASMLYRFSYEIMNDDYDTLKDSGYFQYVGNRELFQDMGPVDIELVLERTYDFTAGDNSRLGVANVMIAWAYAQGIMSGTSATTMSPGESITRAQAATMLMRYHQLYGSTPAPESEPEDYTLQLSCGDLSLEVGETHSLVAKTSTGVYVTFSLTNRNPSVIQVTEPDVLGGNKWVIEALSAGTSEITVTDNNGKSISIVVTVTGEAASSSEPSAAESDSISEVIRLVNEERTKEGLSALQTNDAINRAAQVRANELPTLFEHTRPDGRTCFTALDDAGIHYRTAGENIAAGYTTPEQVVDGWMNSEGHRANILNKDFTTIGVGYNSTGQYWVQLFLG